MNTTLIIFIATLMLGAFTSLLAFKCINYSLPEVNIKFLKYRAIALLILTFGFSLHTFGDVMSYRGEDVEMMIESFAHVFLFISMVVFAIASKYSLEETKPYRFK